MISETKELQNKKSIPIEQQKQFDETKANTIETTVLDTISSDQRNQFDEIVNDVIDTNAFEATPVKDDQVFNDSFEKNDMESLRGRSRIYNNFLKTYVERFQAKSKNQQAMKLTFLIWTMTLLSIIVGAALLCLVIIVLKKEISYTDLATAVSAIVGVISAFIALPKLIAHNLFPSAEDDITRELFSEMFKSDMEIRKLYAPSHTSNDSHMSESKQTDEEQ